MLRTLRFAQEFAHTRAAGGGGREKPGSRTPRSDKRSSLSAHEARNENQSRRPERIWRTVDARIHGLYCETGLFEDATDFRRGQHPVPDATGLRFAITNERVVRLKTAERDIILLRAQHVYITQRKPAAL